MKILLTGGGTGGHITPLLAVAQKLKSAHPNIQLIYVGERGGKFGELTKNNILFDEQYFIRAGKFRRFNGESWLARLLDVRTNFCNVRDAFFVIIGTLQSIRLLGRVRPDAILLKGGFVGAPIGMAARIRRIPFITHDSDALPGLANRLVGRWAVYHATGMPAEFYAYPKEDVRFVGVLVGDAYQPVTSEMQAGYKQALQLPLDSQVLAVTGGSLGARRLNQAVAYVVPLLLERFPRLYIIHQVGKGNADVYGDFMHARLRVVEFMNDLYRYTGAADVVITRAGATALAELGVQGKACIVVPNPQLTGGHQLKNAEHLATKDAVVVVNEASLIAEQGTPLIGAVVDLLQNESRRQHLGGALQALTKQNATTELAELLVSVAEQGRGGA